MCATVRYSVDVLYNYNTCTDQIHQSNAKCCVNMFIKVYIAFKMVHKILIYC